MTWSPFFTLVTPRPTSTTTPAPSWPRIAGNNPSGSAPDSVNSSVWQTPVALISTSTSPSRGPSSWTVDISSGFPAATAMAARTSMSISSYSSVVMSYRAVRHAQTGVAAKHMIGQSGRQMNHNLEHLAARAAPAIFVVFWSTGFVATKYVLHSAEPLTYLSIRMALVVVLMAVIVAIARPKWPDRVGVFHSIVAGILVHGFYLGGTAIAIAHSIPAGLSALIPGLQPILTSTLANRWLGERVTPQQWTGLLLGLAGVVLILHDRPMSGEAGWGWLASGMSLVSITLGTLYQQRYCGKIDWRAGNLVQYIAVTIFFAAGAALFESNVVHWTGEFVLSLIWLAVVLSIGSIGLLYWLIRRSAATSVASLFYLVPAVTAVMAYLLFGERLDGIAIAGMVACAAAVFLVNRRARA